MPDSDEPEPIYENVTIIEAQRFLRWIAEQCKRTEAQAHNQQRGVPHVNRPAHSAFHGRRARSI